MIEIRSNLRECRIKKNLTQDEVARIAKITRAHYTNIELGKKNPSYDLALTLKKIMGCYDDSLFLNNNVSIRHVK